MTTRMIYPTTAVRKTATVNGNVYALTPNAVLEVPDTDVSGLVTFGAAKVALCGLRTARPDPGTLAAGTLFIAMTPRTSPVPAGAAGAGEQVLVTDGAQWSDVLTGAGPLAVVA